jgi:hypothetical protein
MPQIQTLRRRRIPGRVRAAVQCRIRPFQRLGRGVHRVRVLRAFAAVFDFIHHVLPAAAPRYATVSATSLGRGNVMPNQT